MRLRLDIVRVSLGQRRFRLALVVLLLPRGYAILRRDVGTVVYLGEESK